jgi:hypothetical protein
VYNGGSLRQPSSKYGEVPEWTNGTVSKTVVASKVTVGSNPTLSAKTTIALVGDFLLISVLVVKYWKFSGASFVQII